MNENDVKFADMRINDTIQFLSEPATAAPLEGVIVLLNPTMMTYVSEGRKTALRRAALRLERRVRNRDTGHSHWLFL